MKLLPKVFTANQGIPFVRSRVDRSHLQRQFDLFWEYFVKTWLETYDPELWNIERFKDNWEDIQNRTNNALERFNREMNAKLPNNPCNCGLT